MLTLLALCLRLLVNDPQVVVGDQPGNQVRTDPQVVVGDRCPPPPPRRLMLCD